MRNAASKSRKRFLRHVVVKGDDECWPWIGMTLDGYGRMQHNFQQHPAHRFAFALFSADVSVDQVVHHTCGTPDCVNPKHLRAMSLAEHNRLHNFPAVRRNI
jgi:hypothetical protein